MNVNVVSPWYPHRGAAYSGVFVQQNVWALEKLGVEVEVEVPTIYPAPPGPIPPNVIEAIADLARVFPHAVYESNRNTTWIPSPVPSLSGPMGRARAFAGSIEQKRRHLPVSGDLTHAHLGVPTGWAVLQNGDTPLVITEHQSTLAGVFSSADGRRAYRETVDAAAAFFCVSESLRAEVIAALGPEVAPRIEVLPNIVDLTDIPFTPPLRLDFSSWLYVGGLAPHKGIDALLRSFDLFKREFDDSATLTIVGTGTMAPWVKRFAQSRQISDAVHLAGPRPHHEIGSFFAGADVLVHLSPAETFGISCVEAIGAGLPVVSLRNGGAEDTWGDIEELCGRILPLNATFTEISAGIAALKSDPGRLDPVAARAAVEGRFSPATIGRALIRRYEQCLES